MNKNGMDENKKAPDLHIHNSHDRLVGFLTMAFLIFLAALMVWAVSVNRGTGSLFATSIDLEKEPVPGTIVTVGGEEGTTDARGEIYLNPEAGKQTIYMNKTVAYATSDDGSTSTISYRELTADVTINNDESKTGGSAAETVSFVGTMEGYSTIRPWKALKEAVDNVITNKVDTHIYLSYSFLRPGTKLFSNQSFRTVAFGNYVAATTLTSDQFKAEITAAFGQWQMLLESTFCKLNGYDADLFVSFINRGDEAPGSTEITLDSTHTVNGPENIGDFRIGMYDFTQSGISGSTLAYAFAPDINGLGGRGNASGDMLFNMQVHWRADNNFSLWTHSAYSVQYVAAHEMGHAVIGLGHDANSNALMYPLSSMSDAIKFRFPDGVVGRPFEPTAVVGMYAMNKY